MNYSELDLKVDFLVSDRFNNPYSIDEIAIMAQSRNPLDDESRREILNNVINRIERSHARKRYLLPRR